MAAFNLNISLKTYLQKQSRSEVLRVVRIQYKNFKVYNSAHKKV